jgi:general secretion pathway protein M
MLTSPWIQRLAALMLVPLTVGAIYAFVIEPLMSAYRETETRIADTRAQLVHLRRLAEQRPALAAQVEALEHRQDSEGYYLAGGTDALAAVALQDRVKEVVGSGGGSVHSMQPLPGMEERGFRRVTVRVELTAATASLFYILYTLESGRPLVLVDNFGVQNRARPVVGQNGAQPALEDPSLVVDFDLYGYLPAVAN